MYKKKKINLYNFNKMLVKISRILFEWTTRTSSICLLIDMKYHAVHHISYGERGKNFYCKKERERGEREREKKSNMNRNHRLFDRIS